MNFKSASIINTLFDAHVIVLPFIGSNPRIQFKMNFFKRRDTIFLQQ